MPITTGYVDCGTNIYNAGTVTLTWTNSGDDTTVLTAAYDHWPTWVEETTAITTGTTWNYWNAQTIVYMNQPTVVHDLYQPTPAQLEELRAAEVALRERTLERDRQVMAADKRARELLHSLLTETQRESLRLRQHFEIVGQSGKRYRIREGSHGNVRLLDGDKEVAKFCGQPNDVPVADMMLAQKLQLEADEDEFLRRANRTAA